MSAVVRVQAAPFDPGAEIARMHAGNPRVGAVVCFVGVARDLNDGAEVTELTLEHYPGMTENALDEIVEQAKGRWQILDASVIHRIGALRPTEPIVLVVVASAHRCDAFEACAFIMDYLKTQAPFWKKERTPTGERWVATRASDEAAANRWEK